MTEERLSRKNVALSRINEILAKIDEVCDDLRECDTAWRDSTETDGSVTEAVVGDATEVRLIRTIARSNFRKSARN
jgi:hypothetical protein